MIGNILDFFINEDKYVINHLHRFLLMISMYLCAILSSKSFFYFEDISFEHIDVLISVFHTLGGKCSCITS
jgi:hypothetical protein